MNKILFLKSVCWGGGACANGCQKALNPLELKIVNPLLFWALISSHLQGQHQAPLTAKLPVSPLSCPLLLLLIYHNELRDNEIKISPTIPKT